MHVLAHPDPVVLEQELLRRIAGTQEENPAAPVLVLVPSASLADHARRRLAQTRTGCLGVEVLYYHAFVLQTLERYSSTRLATASPRLLRGALDRVLQTLPANLWTRFTASRPGAKSPLLESLQDLREAGAKPEQVRLALESTDQSPDLGEVYGRYVAFLDDHAGSGLVDEAGLVQAALEFAGQAASTYEAILHHGAYELTGVHLQLLQKLDENTAVPFLLPAEPGAPAFSYAENFALRFLQPEDPQIQRLAETGHQPGLLGPRLSFLYKEDAKPLPPTEGTTFAHSQGPAAEVTYAVRLALSRLEKGDSAGEIALVTRHLAPYTAALEQALARRGLPPAERTLPAYLRLVAGPDQAAELERAREYAVETLDYDWGLNGVSR